MSAVKLIRTIARQVTCGGLIWLGLAASAWADTTTVEYIHTDALGSPVAVTNASGAVIPAQAQVYEPYGAPISHGPTDGPGYTGHVEDSATGITYMQQRYYDPELGIFLSVDPVPALKGGANSFNSYRYANGSPYGFTDPDGRYSRDDAKDRQEYRDSLRKHKSNIGVRTFQLGPGRSSASNPAESSTDGTQRPLAGSVTELAENVAGAVIDYTNATLYIEGSGATGVGGTLSFSDSLKTDQAKLDLVGAIGTGAGVFAGAEFDIASFRIPGGKDVSVFFDSADFKYGDLGAIGIKLQANPGGTLTLKGFGGVGFGGKQIVNKPISIGVNLWSSDD